MPTMSGPRKIIDLDATPEDQWKVGGGNVVHLYQDKLWTHITTGCALCTEADRGDAKGQTLQSSEDEHDTICLTHGPLAEYPYMIKREVTIKVGDLEHHGEQEVNDVILIPLNISDDERTSLMARIINLVAIEEDLKDILDDE